MDLERPNDFSSLIYNQYFVEIFRTLNSGEKSELPFTNLLDSA